MRRRDVLSTIAASIGGITVSGHTSSPTAASPYDDPVVETETHRVRHAISNKCGQTRSHWRVETLAGERVWEYDELVEHIHHSYASEYQVFLAIDAADNTARRTIEYRLDDGVTRHREVRRNGETRIYDVQSDGSINIRHA